MIKKTACWAVLVYGIFVALLGIVAYQGKHSVVALIMGGSSGVLLVIAALLMFSQKKSGSSIAIGLTLLLTITFSYRYFVSEQTTPAVLAVLSAGILLFLLASSSKWRRS